MAFDRLQDRTVGRWRSLLPQLGVAAEHLTNKHGPCPCCGGKDRFRFDDKAGKGTWICSRCDGGSGAAGNGIDLAMRVNGWTFKEARAEILKLLPSSVVEMPRTEPRPDGRKSAALWQRAAPLHGSDPASLYLARRGLRFDEWPTQLRYLPNCRYYGDDGQRSLHPAMIAQFVAPDMRSATYQVTYLTPAGQKADVPKPKKLLPGPVPVGGAVRLAPSAETMGIAEGVETALSAMKLFDVPVWASFSDGNMIKFEPPKWVRNLIVFGDNDASLAGQHAAYALGFKRQSEGVNVEVRLPDFEGDWNDVLMMEQPPIQVLEAAE